MSDYCTCCPNNTEYIRQHYDPDALTKGSESPEAVLEIFQDCGEDCPLTLADVEAYVKELRCAVNPLPGYWMNETSGVLRPVVIKYLENLPLSDADIAAIRAYLRQWINAPGWDQNPHLDDEARAQLANFRHYVNTIHSRENIRTYINLLVNAGMDPL